MRYFLFAIGLLWGLPLSASELKFGEKAVFYVQDARTRDELLRGLMFVREMDEDKGMLFDFRSYQDRDFGMWMKNTYISLDMVFLDCDFKVVDFFENAKPMSLESIKSKAKFCYVLEVNGGVVAKQNIQIGDKATYVATK